MRIAALYDIHGNLPALEAVMREVHEEKVDEIVVGGDVFPGPMPLETLQYLLDDSIPKQFIIGNGDREVLAEMKSQSSSLPENVRELIHHSAVQLRSEHIQLIASWKKRISIVIPGLGEVLFCHATPRNDTDIFTRLTPEQQLQPIFNSVTAPIVVCGHTHMQFDRMVGTKRVINAGSVGMPFQESGAYWLLLDSRIELRRTDYSLDDAVERIRRTNYPQANEFAEKNVLHPPSESETLKAFAQVELK